MLPKLTVLDDPQRIEELIRYLADKDYIALDSETTGVHKSATVVGVSFCADLDEAFYVITHEWKDSKLVAYPDRIDVVKRLLLSLIGKSLVMHNGLFDCERIEVNYGISLVEWLHTDTMILAHILDENQRVGLKDLAAQRYGEDSGKEAAEMKESVLANGGIWLKDNKEMYKANAYILGKYGAKDAYLTLRLFYDLIVELEDEGLWDFFYIDETMPLLRGSTYELNTTGLKVDQQKLSALKQQLEAECIEAKAFILSEINSLVKEKYPGTNKKNSFNLGASQQLAWLLYGKMQLEFSTLSKGGKVVCRALGLKLPYHRAAKNDFISVCGQSEGQIYEPEAIVNGKKQRAKKVRAPWAYLQVDKKTLRKYATRYKWIERLLEYQSKMKLLSTYVEGIQEGLEYGIINPSFLQHGTTSGRYSSRNPNFQNLPRDDTRIKSCIVARPGKSFVGADYSQLEPRVFAYFSNDGRLLASFKGEDDFYSVIGMEVYDKTDCIPRKEGSENAFGIKYKKLRDLSKVIALASTYGATAHQLAGTTGKSIEDTQTDIDSYFEKFPGVAQMMLDSHALAKKQGYVTNLFGRKRRIPEATRIPKIYGNISHGDLPYDARKLLNLAVNFRIQSTGASIVNRAAIKFRLNCIAAGIKVKLVLQVHDSLVAECDDKDAEDVALLMQEAMENTVVLSTVALEAQPKIGRNLAEV